MISIKNDDLSLKDNRIIIFEGSDVCGKSTQADLFCNHEAENGTNVVRLKFPFLPENKKLKSINDDMQKYIYDTELLTKIKNNDGTVDFTKCIKQINKIITTNSSANADNKLKIIPFMKYIFNKDIGNALKELNKFKINDNDETFIKIYSYNTTLKLIHLDDKLCEIMSNRNPIIIVLDRYFLSGIIYNFFLPELYYNDFFKKEKNDIYNILNIYLCDNDVYKLIKDSDYDNTEKFINKYTNFKKLIGIKNYNIKKILDVFDDCKKKEIENTKKIIHSINKEIYNIEDGSELYPSVLTLIFKPSELMYKKYLESIKNNVKLNRNNEKYDFDLKIHDIVSSLYNIYDYDETKAFYNMDIVVNDIILSVDSIKLLGIYTIENIIPYFNRIIVKSEFPENPTTDEDESKDAIFSRTSIRVMLNISYKNYFDNLNSLFVDYSNFNKKYKKNECTKDLKKEEEFNNESISNNEFTDAEGPEE